MDNGVYSNVRISSFPEIMKDEYIEEIICKIRNFYNDFLLSGGESGIDSDTSCEMSMDGEMADGVFYPSKASFEFGFVDEMNSEVSQTVSIDFMTGNIFVVDDDRGCIYRGENEMFKLY